MKKFITLVLMLLAACVLVGCNNGSTSLRTRYMCIFVKARCSKYNRYFERICRARTIR